MRTGEPIDGWPIIHNRALDGFDAAEGCGKDRQDTTLGCGQERSLSADEGETAQCREQEAGVHCSSECY